MTTWLRRTRGSRVSSLLWVAVAVFGFVWVFLAGSHLGDRFQLSHVSGAQAALAEWLLSGTFYPEVFDGERVGGTRFFPIPIAVNAAAGWLVGDVVIGGQLVNFLTVAGIVAMIAYVGRRFAGLSTIDALLIGMVLPMTSLGFWMSTTLRHDVVGTFLGLAALVVYAANPDSKRSLWWSGALAASAVFARPTTFWAALALLFASRRTTGLRTIVASGALTTLLLISVFGVVTDGRIADVFRLLYTGDGGFSEILKMPTRIVSQVQSRLYSALVFLPFVIQGFMQSSATVFRPALLTSVLIVPIVFIDPGVAGNHLLDLLVLSLVVGTFGWKALVGAGNPSGRVVGTLVLLVIVGFGLLEALDLEHAYRTGRAVRQEREQVFELLSGGGRVLHEDPGFVVAENELPIVLDPYMVPRLQGESGRRARAWLAKEVSTGKFDFIVLKDPVEEMDPTKAFGVEFQAAVRSRYCLTTDSGRLFVYRPCL